MTLKAIDMYRKPTVLHSDLAEAGAKSLHERVTKGEIGVEVLPNTYVQFTGELEEKDYVSYCSFLNSANGKKILQMLEEEDA